MTCRRPLREEGRGGNSLDGAHTADWTEISLRDLEIIGDRIYAVVRLWRDNDGAGEYRDCVASWSAENGIPLWAAYVK
jgi:hypothetical protein